VFEIINYTGGSDALGKFLSRREVLDEAVEKTVKEILSDVKTQGDEAVGGYTKKFDKVELTDFTVSEAELDRAFNETDKSLIEIMEKAAENIFEFHRHELDKSFFYEQPNGVLIGQKVTAVEKALLYVPGGQAAYPSSVLMNAIPALVAGVSEIYLTTPCNSDGEVHKHILAAAKVLGLKNIYKLGGAQAIAAFAYGTKTLPKVDKITGPGNKYVAMAKRLVFGEVSIDSIAGPSEIAIIADESANPKFIALDLFSQAEHDADASAVLITNSEALAQAVNDEAQSLLPKMERRQNIEAAVENNSAIVLTQNLEEACAVSNIIAPEHLEVHTSNPWDLLPKLQNAGAIFLGHYSSEPVGDYFAGPNHTLPTSGTSRFFSALSTKDFLKRSSIISYTKEMLSATGEQIAQFADAEGLQAHAEAVRVRLGSSKFYKQ